MGGNATGQGGSKGSTGKVVRHGKASVRRASGVNKAGKANAKGSKGNAKSTALTEDVIEAERAALLAEKQAQLDDVYDRHDTLVRETFHMEHFRMMIGFNPQEAKQENSAVFGEYKSKYDLLENAAPSAGPSRKTRSAHTERRQYLVTPSISAPELPPPVKSKPKSKAANPAEIWDILAKAKTKGKEKAAEVEDVPLLNGHSTRHVQETVSAPVGRRTRKYQERSEVQGPDPRDATLLQEAEESISVPLGRRTRQEDGTHRVVKNLPPPRAPNTRRSTQINAPPPITRRTAQVGANECPPPDLPKHNIKRIKLVVRRPPLPLTNPRQRPPRAKYNASLLTFLSSYTSLNGEDIGDNEMQRLAEEAARIHHRVQEFRNEGRFIPGTDVLFGTSAADLTTLFTTPQRESRDTWDDVVEAVIAEGKLRSKRPVGRQIATQIANKIQAYWDGFAARKDRVKLQEERRLRALAKATIKMVASEWKKAVFHIREQERMRLEAEELKRGHEHLDAILDQSGHILETQQGDLSRGDISRSRSRSSSMSASVGYWGSDEEDEVDQGEEEGEEHEDPYEQVSQIEVEQGEDDMSADLAEDEDKEKGDDAGSESEDGDDMEQDDDIGNIASLLLGGVRDSATSAESTPPIRPATPSDSNLDGRALGRDSLPVITTDKMVDEGFEAPVQPSRPPSSPSPEVPAMGDAAPLPSGSAPMEGIAEEARTSPHPIPFQSPDVDMTTESHAAVGSASDSVSNPSDKLSVGEDVEAEEEEEHEIPIPDYLKPFAVAPVEWDPNTQVKPPLLLRGVLRPYQQSGLEWLASLHVNNLNGILADEMGLGKTIQTISLLAHLACDRGIWGPHLIVVPTSVLLNWEMEFKKFLPGFKILSYHGTTKRRKELRQGWNDKHHFNVCITSYTLASRDAHIFKRKAWYYMILDEAHMIKNFKSQRWNILLMFRSFRRLLLTGTPLQNNLTELWALLQFLMSGANFANLKEFGEWFSNPLEKAIEMGNVLDDDTMQRVTKLHTVLRPYLLRRLKRDVEKELPSKYEHLVLCPLSKRQRFLYDEFMSRAQTRDALQSGVYQKIANILMQLRKVCNHPDLFEVRPIVTSFAMQRSVIADFEIKELLIRRRLLDDDAESTNLDILGYKFIDRQNTSLISALETRRLDATSRLPFITDTPGEPPPKDTRTIAGFQRYTAYARRANTIARWAHIGYLNRLRCNSLPIYSEELVNITRRCYQPILPLSAIDPRLQSWDTVQLVNSSVKSYATRAEEMSSLVDKFAFVTPAVVALDMPRIVLTGHETQVTDQAVGFDDVLHRASVKLQIAFPDPSLLQYDCGKLQELASLLREKKAGGHRILIFTQMTRILDILEIFLNFHGYLYLRLDGATKIEDRQYITERFNADPRVFCFIASSRSGGVGINLTGADTVVFYDSDFNPQMDRQCEDRAHRIGQIRDVHIYRFVSHHTVEEAMLRKANQKRSLDDLVIQKGEFDWRSLFGDENALTSALGEFEDSEDAHAAAVAAREEVALEGADNVDFGGDLDVEGGNKPVGAAEADVSVIAGGDHLEDGIAQNEEPGDEGEEEGGTVVDYMLAVVQRDYEYFRDWRL